MIKIELKIGIIEIEYNSIDKNDGFMHSWKNRLASFRTCCREINWRKWNQIATKDEQFGVMFYRYEENINDFITFNLTEAIVFFILSVDYKLEWI